MNPARAFEKVTRRLLVERHIRFTADAQTDLLKLLVQAHKKAQPKSHGSGNVAAVETRGGMAFEQTQHHSLRYEQAVEQFANKLVKSMPDLERDLPAGVAQAGRHDLEMALRDLCPLWPIC